MHPIAVWYQTTTEVIRAAIFCNRSLSAAPLTFSSTQKVLSDEIKIVFLKVCLSTNKDLVSLYLATLSPIPHLPKSQIKTSIIKSPREVCVCATTLDKKRHFSGPCGPPVVLADSSFKTVKTAHSKLEQRSQKKKKKKGSLFQQEPIFETGRTDILKSRAGQLWPKWRGKQFQSCCYDSSGAQKTPPWNVTAAKIILAEASKRKCGRNNRVDSRK